MCMSVSHSHTHTLSLSLYRVLSSQNLHAIPLTEDLILSTIAHHSNGPSLGNTNTTSTTTVGVASGGPSINATAHLNQHLVHCLQVNSQDLNYKIQVKKVLDLQHRHKAWEGGLYPRNERERPIGNLYHPKLVIAIDWEVLAFSEMVLYREVLMRTRCRRHRRVREGDSMDEIEEDERDHDNDGEREDEDGFPLVGDEQGESDIDNDDNDYDEIDARDTAARDDDNDDDGEYTIPLVRLSHPCQCRKRDKGIIRCCFHQSKFPLLLRAHNLPISPLSPNSISPSPSHTILSHSRSHSPSPHSPNPPTTAITTTTTSPVVVVGSSDSRERVVVSHGIENSDRDSISHGNGNHGNNSNKRGVREYVDQSVIDYLQRYEDKLKLIQLTSQRQSTTISSSISHSLSHSHSSSIIGNNGPIGSVNTSMKRERVNKRDRRVRRNQHRDHRPGLTIEHILREYMSSESITGYSCETCKRETNGMMYTSIHRLPDVLILHLKRLVMNSTGGMKVKTLVKFPIEGLTMSSFTTRHFYQYQLKEREKERNELIEKEREKEREREREKEKEKSEKLGVGEESMSVIAPSIGEIATEKLHVTDKGRELDDNIVMLLNENENGCDDELDSTYDLFGVVNHLGEYSILYYCDNTMY